MRVWLRAAVQTDPIRPELRGRVLYSKVTGDDTEAFADAYRTSGGLETTVVTYSESSGDKTWSCVDGCFSLNGLHYYLEASGREMETEILGQTMKEVLDGFQ